ncbi:MAG: hypothetical protein ABFS24_03965 [Pseudomonadota bacterium]
MKYNLFITAILTLALLPGTALAKQDKRDYTDKFPIAGCQFLTDGGENPYVILDVGRVTAYDNSQCLNEEDCDELEEFVITVTGDTHVVNIDGQMITTRVVLEEEYVDGELLEISHNYFAECAGTQDVYYFGESVDIFEDCDTKDPINFEPPGCVTHDGAWEAGVDDAQPGIQMPGGAFIIGARYFQEVVPDIALDRAEHIANGLDITVPAGSFEDCVEIRDTSALDKKSVDTKIYCPGTGLVSDEETKLISVTP